MIMSMDLIPVRYIGEQVEVEFDTLPAREKSPPCPQVICWRGESLRVVELLAEWASFERRGRMARNMQPQHAAVASHRGSLGVGRFYFRIRVADGRCFEIYYDRAIKDSDHRKGDWVLVGEYGPAC